MNEAASSRANELSPAEWHVLNSLSDATEPIEECARTIREAGIVLSADEFLATAYSLFRLGFVNISQAPIPAFGQEFAECRLSLSQPSQIVGDLDSEFRATYSHGNYLRLVPIPADAAPAGVPFGIYFDLTPAGRVEWNKPIYESLYR